MFNLINIQKPNFLDLRKKQSCFSSIYNIVKKNEDIKLIVHGQGVFLFNTNIQTSFTFYNNDKSDGLKVDINNEEVFVSRLNNGDKYNSQTKKGGLINKSGVYYWFSLDSQNQRLQCGVGEPRLETSIFDYQFDLTDKLKEANKIFLESLTTITISNTVNPIKLLKNPVTFKLPLLIKNTNELTMDDVASNSYLPHSSLSLVALSLYNCVSGEKFILNTPDFPEFSEAIEYSIATPGLWCNTRLKEKATEFGKDPNPLETYLRITLGQNNGESPGIPYVMEIWPIGHYSPIHNHSGANAIIRVLHGSINVSLFPFLCDDINTILPFAKKDFNKDDITWLSPNFNQIHQLKNLESNKETCITIQCYLYDENDKIHYDYFDYLGEKNAKSQYEPDSDMDFIEFKKLMKKEWENKNE